jgi:hypothetical protein
MTINIGDVVTYRRLLVASKRSSEVVSSQSIPWADEEAFLVPWAVCWGRRNGDAGDYYYSSSLRVSAGPPVERRLAIRPAIL